MNTTTTDRSPSQARRRAGVVAAVAGLGLLPWFFVTEAVVPLDPTSPAIDMTEQEFVGFYVENFDRIPWNATSYLGQWMLLLVLVVSVIHAATERKGLAAALATTLAAGSTAIYAMAEGLLVWPILAANMDVELLSAHLDPTLAQTAVLARDGVHSAAAVLLGTSVLLVAWLLLRSDLWGHRVMAALAALSGAWALSSVIVGPDGFGPGLILILWGPVTAVLLLVGLRRSRGSDAPVSASAR